MGIASLSFHSPQISPPPQKPPAKQKVLIVSLLILSSYTLYDTFVGQQYLLQYGDKLRIRILFKKRRLDLSEGAEEALKDSLKSSSFPEHVTLLFQTSLPQEKGRRKELTELTEKAQEILSQNWSQPGPYSFYIFNNHVVSGLFYFLYYSAFLLELPVFLKLLYLDLKRGKQTKLFFSYALGPYSTKQVISLLLSFLEKQGLVSNSLFKRIDNALSYPLGFLSKEEKSWALAVLSITLPLSFIWLLYLGENNYNKGLDHLASIDTSSFPLPQFTHIKVQDKTDSDKLGIFFEGTEKLATVSCQSRDYLFTILHRFDRLNKSKKALGLSQKQALFYLKFDKSNIQETLNKCLEVLEECSCEHPILILDKEKINSFLKKNTSFETKVKKFLERVKESEDCESVKILVIEDSKERKDSSKEVDTAINSFSSSSVMHEIQKSLEEIAVYNLRAVLYEETCFSIASHTKEATEALKEFWKANCKSNEEPTEYLNLAQNKLKKLAKNWEKKQLKDNPHIRSQYLDYTNLKKKTNRVKEEQKRVVVEMSAYFEARSLARKKDALDLLKDKGFQELQSDFLVLEKALEELLNEEKEKASAIEGALSSLFSSFLKSLTHHTCA